MRHRLSQRDTKRRLLSPPMSPPCLIQRSSVSLRSCSGSLTKRASCCAKPMHVRHCCYRCCLNPSSATTACSTCPAHPPGDARGTMRRQIVALLREYPEGLTPAEIGELLGVDRSLTDTCQGMLRYGLLR